MCKFKEKQKVQLSLMLIEIFIVPCKDTIIEDATFIVDMKMHFYKCFNQLFQMWLPT